MTAGVGHGERSVLGSIGFHHLGVVGGLCRVPFCVASEIGNSPATLLTEGLSKAIMVVSVDGFCLPGSFLLRFNDAESG